MRPLGTQRSSTDTTKKVLRFAARRKWRRCKRHVDIDGALVAVEALPGRRLHQPMIEPDMTRRLF
jgi:hypothetical protein